MNLPIFLGAIAVPAKQIVQQTGLVASSTNLLFGNLLRTEPTMLVNGRSEGASPTTQKTKSNTSTSKDWDSQFEAIRERLRSILDRSRIEFGLNSLQHAASEFSLSLGAESSPVVHGPEPMRTDVENVIRNDRGLVAELQNLISSRVQIQKSHSPQGFATETNIPWTIGFSSAPKF